MIYTTNLDLFAGKTTYLDPDGNEIGFGGDPRQPARPVPLYRRLCLVQVSPGSAGLRSNRGNQVEKFV